MRVRGLEVYRAAQVAPPAGVKGTDLGVKVALLLVSVHALLLNAYLNMCIAC